MDIATNEIQKIKKVLEILDFQPEEIDKTVSQIEKIMTAKIFAEALERKNFKSSNGEYNDEEVQKFLNDNYPQDKMAVIVKEVGTKFVTDYFANILKNVPEEKLKEVEDLIRNF